MKSIIEDIKNQKFSHCYLFYGEENYLKKQYRDKLVQALAPEDDTMNVSRFSGRGQSQGELIDLAETLPFFAERRVLVIEDSGFFKNQANELADYLAALPDYLHLIFVEEEVDKRSRMYKAVNKYGRAVEFARQDEKTLMRWVLGKITKENKKITQRDMELFLNYVGNDMGNISCELEKLLSYTLEKQVIAAEDIEAVCAVQINNRIFEMVRAVTERKQKKALELYYDLLALHEPPMRILYLISRQYNLILQVMELQESGCDNKTIASRTGLQSFLVKNYLPYTKCFSKEELKSMIEACTAAEEAVKTGRLADTMSVELLICSPAPS